MVLYATRPQDPQPSRSVQQGQSNALLNFRKDAVQAVAPRLVVAPALAVSTANRSVISTLHAGCHFYLAPTPRSGGTCGHPAQQAGASFRDFTHLAPDRL